jgi:hypothetical protein
VLLDHFAIAQRGDRVPTAARARVAGFCGEVGCARFPQGELPTAFQHLSDHCPVLLDIGGTPAM